MGYPRAKFYVEDYSVSDTYPELAAHQQIPDMAETKLYYIHTMLILPLMKEFGMPLITSAFRDPQLNAAIGSKSRQHRAGEAVDFLWPESNLKVYEAFEFIEEEMYHQTGWCYLWVDLENNQYKHIHWALPLSPSAIPRKNPEKFWYYYNNGFHQNLPMEVHEWQTV